MSKARTYDVVVWGATGFTGALVAEYLRDRYGVGKQLRWAIAGRNEVKLEELKHDLGSDCAELPVLTADSHDEASLRELARSTAGCYHDGWSIRTVRFRTGRRLRREWHALLRSRG